MVVYAQFIQTVFDDVDEESHSYKESLLDLLSPVWSWKEANLHFEEQRTVIMVIIPARFSSNLQYLLSFINHD